MLIFGRRMTGRGFPRRSGSPTGFDKSKLFFALQLLFGAGLSFLVVLVLGRWFREFHGTEFRRVRELVDGFYTEVFEEEIGGGVEEGSAGKVGPPVDLDQLPVEELLQDAV